MESAHQDPVIPLSLGERVARVETKLDLHLEACAKSSEELRQTVNSGFKEIRTYALTIAGAVILGLIWLVEHGGVKVGP